MTSKLYLESDNLRMTTTVISSTLDEDGRFRTCLAETLFHPQGGGQPYDVGRIGTASVLGVFLENEEVVHITDQQLPCGEYEIEVDADKRQLNTRMHSAGHLIAAVGENIGWNAIKGNHRPGEGRIVFTPGSEGIAPPEVHYIHEEVNKLVAQALLREQHITDGIRRITWGELPLYACGGTHVPRTDWVGEVVIGNVKFRKGQLSVSYELVQPTALTIAA